MDIPGQTHATSLKPSLVRSGYTGDELRVAFRFTTTRKIGPPADRAKRIADDLAILDLGRNCT
jgi:hypothetical protein